MTIRLARGILGLRGARKSTAELLLSFMSKGKRRRGFRVASSSSKSKWLGTLKFEDYEKVFLAPVISLILGVGTYFCKHYAEKFPEVALYETVAVAACLAGVFVLLLYVPVFLFRIFTYKRSAIIAFLVIILALAVLVVPATQFIWRYTANGTHPMENGSLTNSTDSDEITKTEPTEEVLYIPTQHPKQQAQPSSTHYQAERNHKQTSQSSDVVNPVEFDGDCLRFSQQLLSQPDVLHYPQKYHIHSQVEMFEQPVLVKGKPSFPVFAGDPYEFEGDALDLYSRHHNAGAQSSVSVEDAVEKALTQLCETLRREGFGDR